MRLSLFVLFWPIILTGCQSVDQSLEPEELLMLAEDLMGNGDWKAAIRHYARAAELNNPHGQAILAGYYQYGLIHDRDKEVIGRVTQNTKRAHELYADAAAALSAMPDRDIHETNLLAALYYNGSGVERNMEAGLALWLEAAEQGDAEALYNFGFMGLWTQGKHEEAYPFLKSAAESGYSPAQHVMHLVYRDGYGVEIDYEKATYWLRCAAKAGNINAIRNLRTLKEYGEIELSSDDTC